MDDAKNPFELNIENSNMLPIDQSLHAFMLQLNEGRAEKDQLTAKLVCNALGAVPKESDQAAPEDSIYQDVFKNKYDNEDRSGRHTYPIPIFWETQDLFRAICKGRKQNRKLKNEPLAKASLEFLIDDLKKRNPTTVGERYQDFQLLKDEYIRSRLIEDAGGEIRTRLGLIHGLVIPRSANQALKRMKLAFPVLDELIIRLLQEESVGNEDGSECASPLKSLQEYYARLLECRPKPVLPDPNSLAFKVTFQPTAQPELTKDLVERLKKLGSHPDDTDKLKETQKAKRAKKAQEAQEAFGQYLRRRSGEMDPEGAKTADEFAFEYAGLMQYIQRSESWSSTQKLIRKELYTYIRNLCSDAVNLDYVPYDYASYEETDASTAFIRELCRHAHNQIRAAVHHPLRLIQESAYLAYFYPVAAAKDPDTAAQFAQALGTLLAPQLLGWENGFSQEIDRLKNHCVQSLPKAPNELTPGGVASHQRHVVKKLYEDTALFRKELKILRSPGMTWIQCVQQKTVLLLWGVRAVAVDIADTAEEEMRQQYECLQEWYQKKI